ncbi:anhydro-N-acetylmuramic acid kinase [Ferrimonas sediminicola]|uniref:Anhydro-N-acetylmuramic acid kinase n=1 Tax=Ferrimonas sediminicola TaxID=2569538 RepID=A0A4U1BJX3_9GAMM|nr:anhydro-N-acetylmuramic acid kinase [Ferrimonas sediminicola]TKB51512.1 anhydro-N-acetylmuramic acid kinase [Ferrimonas sediminicola]
MSRYIGLMSGTSMDGIDAVLVEFQSGHPVMVASHTHEYDPHLLEQLHRLCSTGEDEVNRLGHVDRQVGRAFAQAVHGLLAKSGLAPEDIRAIGSHGQTVRHQPEGLNGFSLQLGDPNTMAVETGIDVVADFRRKDIALGGQGAPLVPAFHLSLFSDDKPRIIVNIGGIANITWLPGDNTPVLGFDTGPGNTLMDAWARQHIQQPYDKDGAMASRGRVQPELLKRLMSHPYFAQPAPKSTGRELFNQAWLNYQLEPFMNLAPEDIQATLLAFTVDTMAREILALSPDCDLYLCGGGAFNGQLVRQLGQALPRHRIQTTDALGVPPQWVEGMAFAWLAMRHVEGLPGNLPSATGARRPAVLGSLTPAG